MQLRPALADDAGAIASIYAHYVEQTAITFDLEAPSAEQWRDKLAAARAAGYAWFVAQEGDAVVGYASSGAFMGRPAYRSTVLTSIYLREDARGRGIGRALYELLLGELGAAFHLAVAGITLPNDASVALHEKLGFTFVGVFEQVGHKLGAWHDVGWWQRRLP